MRARTVAPVVSALLGWCEARPVTIRSVPRFRATVIAFAVTILVATTLIGAHVDAAPTGRPTAVAVALQNPGWTTNTFLANLADAGIPIYAPTYIPDPFSALPSIDAGPVYYSLYWVVPGAPPTYLRITGERDGVIPGYSYYDRNKPLEQNTTVLGYPAWHDETPIYDLLYVDIDVHHGDGSASIFAADADVLVLSVHRFGAGFYPGSAVARRK